MIYSSNKYTKRQWLERKKKMVTTTAESEKEIRNPKVILISVYKREGGKTTKKVVDKRRD
jgi:hypothetical protein